MTNSRNGSPGPKMADGGRPGEVRDYTDLLDEDGDYSTPSGRRLAIYFA